MSSLQLSLLLFSVNVRYQTSSSLHSVSQKLAHNQHKPTNKTEYSLFHIPLLIISLTELFLIFFSILFNQHKPTNKTEYSLFHIPLLIISLTELFLIFFSILFKFENSSREIDTARLT